MTVCFRVLDQTTSATNPDFEGVTFPPGIEVFKVVSDLTKRRVDYSCHGNLNPPFSDFPAAAGAGFSFGAAAGGAAVAAAGFPSPAHIATPFPAFTNPVNPQPSSESLQFTDGRPRSVVFTWSIRPQPGVGHGISVTFDTSHPLVGFSRRNPAGPSHTPCTPRTRTGQGSGRP